MSHVNPPELNISLESHLLEVLEPLPLIVPPELATALISYLSPLPASTISYPVLLSVSQWSRTSHGIKQLRAHSPPLDPRAYSIISLLAGTTTSPERKFGEYIPAKEPEEIEAERKKERKTITALLNALLSIGGSGVATWWAADKTGWNNEWRVLLSLFVAIVVAISEAVLYVIWQSRRSSKSKARHGPAHARHKKHDGDSELPGAINAPLEGLADGGLRRRQ